MITIFADTTSSIPVHVAKELGIEYLPQIIVFGDETFRDDTEMDSKTFLERLKTSSTLPKTSAPSPMLYHPLIEKHLKQGDEIIILTPSSKVSGTLRSAETAVQDFPNSKIHILDTMNIGASFASIVINAVNSAKNGNSAENILTLVNNLIQRERNLFVVDTLEYLYKGGRIGGAKMLFGSLLQVKPLLSLKKGQVEPVESQRTKKRAIARMVELIKEECPPSEKSLLSIQHGGAWNDADNLSKELKAWMNVENLPIYELPAAFLVHAGPGVLGVSYFVD